MARKRKVPEAGEFDVPRERLWHWLVEHAGADTEKIEGDPAAVRRGVTSRIQYEGQMSSDPAKKRAGAVAGALLDLELAATERKTAAWYLRHRVDSLEKATQAISATEALCKSWRDLAERAQADRADVPGLVRYWPEEIARELAARDVGLIAAIAIIEDYRNAIDKLGENVWGSDTVPGVLRKIDSVALHLANGGFPAGEIADLLDETNDEPALKADRWRKRVAWAHDKVGQESEIGAPDTISDAGCGPRRDSSRLVQCRAQHRFQTDSDNRSPLSSRETVNASP